MPRPFGLLIVTPEQFVLEGEATLLEAFASDGWLGVLADHAPMVALLRPCRIRWRDTDGADHFLGITGGVLDVGENKVKVMADDLVDGESDPSRS